MDEMGPGINRKSGIIRSRREQYCFLGILFGIIAFILFGIAIIGVAFGIDLRVFLALGGLGIMIGGAGGCIFIYGKTITDERL